MEAPEALAPGIVNDPKATWVAHSALMLAARVTLAHFPVSAAISFPNPIGVIGIGEPPRSPGGIVKVPHVIIQPGAFRIKADSEAIAAIGVGGAPGGDKDEACAKAGLDKISDRLK
ncbi:MAG: heme-binding protein [Xanthobacteraceae bacterium]